uniref:RIB43A domain with coiled-coils 2 n=1 Tax=Amphilophus citrinellus TaxID=61819 RepID=A0A3Q0RTH5_AMPCI
MLNAELLSDRLARASLEKRRHKETERKERIFNDKLRTIGVDKEALDMQVKEKREQEAAAKKEQIAYDADMCRNSKVARILHNRQMKEKRALEKDIVTYRRQHQQPGERHGYDLNGSDRVKTTEQSDAQMMPPGLVGEDPESKSRLQRQREQLREWLIQQQTAQAAERHQQKLEGGNITKAKWKGERQLPSPLNTSIWLWQTAHTTKRNKTAVVTSTTQQCCVV